MCVVDFEITEADFNYAERVLLPEGCIFGTERRSFIEDFSTLDLHAVPGSGKTTLLLAKLLIMERYLPLLDNRAVLVISHTNTAVQEIEDRIKKFCPKLFSYPNFVGTIQSFANKFLAFPYFENIKNLKINSIDSDRFKAYVENYYSKSPILNKNPRLNMKHDVIAYLSSIRFDEDLNLIPSIAEEKCDFDIKDTNSKTYTAIRDMKIKILGNGVLHYDDTYSLSFKYLKDNPFIKDILSMRFSYVFVDEMQDMGPHQYKLLEELFYNDNKSNSSYQRIGDNNQAIYSDSITENIWTSRQRVKNINGSHRLSRLNAKSASYFSIDGTEILGKNSFVPEYKPILIVFDIRQSQCDVIHKFAKLVEEKFDEKCYMENYPNVKVVSWRKEHSDKSKISLASYCPMYSDSIDHTAKTQINLDLQSSTSNTLDFHELRLLLLSHFVSLLNECDHLINGKEATITRMLNELKEKDLECFKTLNSKVYYWCKCILIEQEEINQESFDEYENDFMLHFGITPLKKIEINSSEAIGEEKKSTLFNCEKCFVRGEEITVCSAHSIKGQTHDATLFLESFYSKNYESDIIGPLLNGLKAKDFVNSLDEKIQSLVNRISELGGMRGTNAREKELKSAINMKRKVLQYSKLIFVALTRAKGITAYGLSKDQFDKHLKEHIKYEDWDVYEL
jgi:DNA helicase II / ATP-dependent DNA helicase PcrA